MQRFPRSLLAAGAALVLAGSAARGRAQDPPTAEPTAAEAETVDADALDLARRMAELLAATPALRVEAESEYEAVQRDGQKIEFGATREISLRRPDRFRVETTTRAGARRTLFFDGARISLLDAVNTVYASVAKTGDFDAALDYLVAQLATPVPLGELFSKDLPRHLSEGIVFARSVGEETIDGVRCDHLALRKEGLGIQLWVQQGEQPLPRRLVVTYENAPEQPQFRARLFDWDLSPSLPDSLFAFEPPEGAQPIVFAPPPRPALAPEGR